jgi:vacuolar-type H+-ATPase subunit B/Vma2
MEDNISTLKDLDFIINNKEVDDVLQKKLNDFMVNIINDILGYTLKVIDNQPSFVSSSEIYLFSNSKYPIEYIRLEIASYANRFKQTVKESCFAIVDDKYSLINRIYVTIVTKNSKLGQKRRWSFRDYIKTCHPDKFDEIVNHYIALKFDII